MRFVNLTIPFLGSSLSMARVIRSKPGDSFCTDVLFSPFELLLASVSSVSKSSRFSFSCCNSFRSSWFVVKTFPRYFANSSVPSLSSLAETTSFYLSGGICAISNSFPYEKKGQQGRVVRSEVEQYSVGKSREDAISENGRKIIGFCISTHLIVCNSFFNHKDMRKFPRTMESRDEKPSISQTRKQRGDE